jgi:hypothetical protein
MMISQKTFMALGIAMRGDSSGMVPIVNSSSRSVLGAVFSGDNFPALSSAFFGSRRVAPLTLNWRNLAARLPIGICLVALHPSPAFSKLEPMNG